jgi:hypothetical protein
MVAMSCISGPVTRPCGLVTHERNETIAQLQHLIDVNLFVIVWARLVSETRP